MNKKALFISIATSVILSGCQNEKETNKDEVVQIAQEAYLYGVPLILTDITCLQWTDMSTGAPLTAPINTFAHNSKLPQATPRVIVRPNVDTYYSSAFLDLSQGPVLLSVPNTDERYYLLPVLDAFTNVCYSPGKRTTGTLAKKFLLAGPDYKGDKQNADMLYKMPTNTAWIIGRTQVNATDGEDAEKVQKAYTLTSLATPDNLLKRENPFGTTEPNTILGSMPVDSFFRYMNRLLVHNPPLAADKTLMARLAQINIGPGKTFRLEEFDTETQQKLKALPNLILGKLKQAGGTADAKTNYWNVNFSSMGLYTDNYSERAAIAYNGLGANLPEDAVYPTCGKDHLGMPLNGESKYEIRFEKNNLPPANAFWSLTLYDEDGYFYNNPEKIYALGDRSNLTEENGVVTIYIQNTPPTDLLKQKNWLPAPKARFNLTMRIYWPNMELLKSWTPPAVTKK